MDVPGRILAIDPGSKRIGYAISDDLRQTARPLEVWTKRGRQQDLEHLAALVEAHEVVAIVVGLPFRLDGSESTATERARVFLEEIRARFPELEVASRDEALTTWDAEQRMLEAGIPSKVRKAQVDAYAALVLLEEELAARARARIQEAGSEEG